MLHPSRSFSLCQLQLQAVHPENAWILAVIPLHGFLLKTQAASAVLQGHVT